MSSSIQMVADNQAKFLSYQKNFKRYNDAMRGGYYFECLFILFAATEDRTMSFLYHIGLLAEAERNRITHSKKIKKSFRAILDMKENEKYHVDSFNGKTRTIKKLLEWSLSERSPYETDYEKDLRKALSRLACDQEFCQELFFLEGDWRRKRNELTHALLNKNPEAVLDEVVSLLEKGYHAIRELDKVVKVIKKERLREKYKIK